MQGLRTREREMVAATAAHEEAVRNKFDGMLRAMQEENHFERKEMERKFSQELVLIPPPTLTPHPPRRRLRRRRPNSRSSM